MEVRIEMKKKKAIEEYGKLLDEYNLLAIRYISQYYSLIEISNIKLESGEYRRALKYVIGLAKNTIKINKYD
jgi:hypothetical protein